MHCPFKQRGVPNTIPQPPGFGQSFGLFSLQKVSIFFTDAFVPRRGMQSVQQS